MGREREEEAEEEEEAVDTGLERCKGICASFAETDWAIARWEAPPSTGFKKISDK